MNTCSPFNYFWKFKKLNLESTVSQALKQLNDFDLIKLPHDWLISNVHDLYENSSGWYHKTFQIEDYDSSFDKNSDHFVIRFDGVYMDCSVYLNGQPVGEWKYGYTTFELDITDYLVEGTNALTVGVKHQSPNSRWYSGAGIYRNVWVKTYKSAYIPSDEIYVSTTRTKEDWVVDIESLVINETEVTLKHTLYYGDEVVATTASECNQSIKGRKHKNQLIVTKPNLWSFSSPNLYTLKTELYSSEIGLYVSEQSIGFKEVVMDPKNGFMLNGQSYKLNGVCEHHDLGCLGAEVYTEALKRRIVKLKKMGVNAIRTAHNMPAPELMSLCDAMGVLVVSEAFDMWERSKTPYDYARFFEAWHEKDVERWVKRDRNHVALLMWSIGNEIYDTHADERGQEVTLMLKNLVHEHDPKHNAVVTIGSNFMPWENAQKCADLVTYAGYNYAEKYYEAHHEIYPEWVIYGSETASIVQSRGIYHFPLRESILSDDDCQCSALGNSRTSWGAKSYESCVTVDKNIPFSLGQFLWTGYDYIGEPTPYHTKNSYFGQVDTAGFEKDSYYVYQAGWTDYKIAPMIHLFPYWDFNEGQWIDVRVCSNAPVIELFFNNESLGKRRMNPMSEDGLIMDWSLPYKSGQLKALAYNEEGVVIAEAVRESFFEPVAIKAKADLDVMKANHTDLVYVDVTMVDSNGVTVENCNRRINVTVKGPARLLGMDNGDSTDYEGYKVNTRQLFSGHCLVVIGSTLESGDVKICIESEGIKAQTIQIASVEVPLCDEAYKAKGTGYVDLCPVPLDLSPEPHFVLPIRKIELKSEDGCVVTKENNGLLIKARCYPVEAEKQDLLWRVVNNAGIDSGIAKMEVTEEGCRVIAHGDGQFKVRCMVYNNKAHPDIISELDFVAKGFGEAFKNPYKMVTGGLCDVYKGDITPGNDRGVASARNAQTVIGYRQVDFGEVGSDEVTLPIFAFDSTPHKIEIYKGMPGEEGSERIDEVIYEKPTIWNTYQEQTYKLSKRLIGVSTIAFVFYDKVHLKGFVFKKIHKAYEQQNVLNCNHIYGDRYDKKEWGIGGIGNNVSLIFEQMDFTIDTIKDGAKSIEICGRTSNDNNTIRIESDTDQGSLSQVIEFPRSTDFVVKTFDLESITGSGTIQFIFLPGSQFDFKWFRFK